MSTDDHAARPLQVASILSLAIWTLWTLLQIRNWAWQNSTFGDGLPVAGEYSQPIGAPALRLIWLAGVLASIAVLAVVWRRRAAANQRRGSEFYLAGAGLVLGLTSLWFTPSSFGSDSQFVEEPSLRFGVGILVGVASAAIYLALVLVERHGSNEAVGIR